MASNVNLVAANIVPENHRTLQGVAGEVISAGEFVYLKASDGRLWKAQSDGTAAEAAVVGIALSTVAAAGQYLTYTDSGDITSQTGSWASIGDVIYLGTTAGKGTELGQQGPAGVGERVVLLGFTIAANKLRLMIRNTGLLIAA